MAYVNSITDIIGDTPLLSLARFSEAVGLAPDRLLGKVEYLNPSGSVKDRIALRLIEKAETDGQVTPGGTIIEGSSGNMGVALAMVSAMKGYQFICVVADKVSHEKQQMIQAFGGKVIVTPTEALADDPENYINVAKRLEQEIPNSVFISQFTNLGNPQAHYETTGKEIWEDSKGKVQAIVGGVGTGGTISGVGRYLKDQNPDVKVVIGDPVGSIISGHDPSAKPSWYVEGIGEDFFPETYDAHIADAFYKVTDAQSFEYARLLCRTEGLLVGGTTGTLLAAAIKFAESQPELSPIVVMLPDSGRSYLTKMYNSEWLKEHNLPHEL